MLARQREARVRTLVLRDAAGRYPAAAPIDGLVVTAITVPHRDEFSGTVAFVRGTRRPQGRR